MLYSPLKDTMDHSLFFFLLKQRIRKLQTEVEDARRKVVVANAATKRIEEAYAALKKEVSVMLILHFKSMCISVYKHLFLHNHTYSPLLVSVYAFYYMHTHVHAHSLHNRMQWASQSLYQGQYCNLIRLAYYNTNVRDECDLKFPWPHRCSGKEMKNLLRRELSTSQSRVSHSVSLPGLGSLKQRHKLVFFCDMVLFLGYEENLSK